MFPHVKAGGDRHLRPADKFQNGGDVGGHRHIKTLPGARAGGNGATAVRRLRRTGQGANGAKQIDQTGQVIGPHIQHRAATRGIVEIGVGVPKFVPRHHHEARSRHHLADCPAIQHRPRGLMHAAQKRIGRRPDPQTSGLGGSHQRCRLIHRHRQWLFGIDMLARRQRCQPDRHMMLRRGQVQHDADTGVGQQSLNAQRLQPVSRRLGRGRRRVDIGAGHHVQNRKLRRGFQVSV